MRLSILSLVLLFSFTSLQAQLAPQSAQKKQAPSKALATPSQKPPTTTTKDITGYWLTANRGTIIQFYQSGNVFNGKVAWLRKPNDKSGKPQRDIYNPDKSKRNNPVMGSLMVYDLKYNPKNGQYEGGKIYMANVGKVYDCKVKLTGNGNKMEITGTAGLSMISKTLYWTRIKGIPSK